jgi:hypothetical protein
MPIGMMLSMKMALLVLLHLLDEMDGFGLVFLYSPRAFIFN